MAMILHIAMFALLILLPVALVTLLVIYWRRSH